MLKTMERATLTGFIGLSILLLVLTGCTGGKDRRELSAGSESAKQHAMFDRDSRNNEDDTLGVKPRWVEDQMKVLDSDMEDRFRHENVLIRHSTQAMEFAPEVSRQLEPVQGIKQAIVVLTK